MLKIKTPTTSSGLERVANRARTGDPQNHNLML
jgi:hypothetical protein